LGDIENAIKTDPWIPQNYTSLATYWILQRNPEKQKAAQLEAERLMSAIADGDQAWLAATSHNADHRNGADALRLAKQACAATDYRWWGGLKSLAAAHAELGEFDQALEFAAKAIDLAPPEEADSIAKQRRAYESRKAWRDRG
jgi:tetratricopeptide (TPR) repeat protein